MTVLHTSDLQEKLKVLKKNREVKHIGEELKALSGRAEKKYKESNSYELSEYGKVRTQVFELYPSGHIPTVEKSITVLRQKLSKKNTEYDQADKKSRELADAQRTIEEYLRHEQSREEQQKRKRNDLSAEKKNALRTHFVPRAVFLSFIPFPEYRK